MLAGLVPVFAEEIALESLERSRDASGAVYPGKELLAEIKRELLRGNNAAAKRALARARGSYGQVRETLLLDALLDTMEHNYRGALQSLGAVKNGGRMLKDQSERFRKAEKNTAALVRAHGRNYTTSFAVPGESGDSVYLPDRNVFLFAAGGVLYRYDTRSGAKAVAGRPGAGRTFGMAASYVPEITAVAVKTGGRYVIKVFSDSQPGMASELEKKIAAPANNITPFLSLDGQTFLFASDRDSSREASTSTIRNIPTAHGPRRSTRVPRSIRGAARSTRGFMPTPTCCSSPPAAARGSAATIFTR